jgi:FkbM family methyltransferase
MKIPQFKISPVNLKNKILNFIIFRTLEKRSKNILAKRKQPMVVFANDYIGINIFLHGEYDSNGLLLLKHIFDHFNIDYKNSSLVDVGANIGNHSLFFGGLFKKIYSFEPNPTTFELLKINTQNKNISSFNLGLGSKKEKLLLFESLENNGTSSLNMDKSVHKGKAYTVDIDTLDNFDFSNELVSVIKIDVEGHEFEVLQGGKKLIDEMRPIIILEVHASDFTTRDNTSSLSIDFLTKKNYLFIVPDIENVYLSNPNSVWKKFTLLFKSLIFDNSMNIKVVNGLLPVGHYDLVAIPAEKF